MAKKKNKETYSYKGWLISDSFIKRALAVYGYTMVASIIVLAAVYGVLLILGLISLIF